MRNVKEGEKDGKDKGEARRRRVCLSMYSINENIYYSQLSSVALLLQPERNCLHCIIQGKDWVLSPYVLSSCGLSLPPTCLLVTVNEARSYFASTIHFSLPVSFMCDDIHRHRYNEHSIVSYFNGAVQQCEGEDKIKE
jgi:hypothetical protein